MLIWNAAPLREVRNSLRSGNYFGTTFSGPSGPKIPVARLSGSNDLAQLLQDIFKPIPGRSPCPAGAVILDLPVLETLHLVADKISRYKMF